MWQVDSKGGRRVKRTDLEPEVNGLGGQGRRGASLCPQVSELAGWTQLL